jgi:LPXTG-motif cell wall-anchored protein
MKKILAVVVIIAMTVALGLTAFAETVYTDTEGGVIWDASFWLSNDSEIPANHSGRTIDAVINASGAISELGVPNYWASNPAVEGMANAVAHVNVYKFDVNYAKTKQGTPVASAEIELAGDSNVGTTTEVAGTNCKVTANGNAGIMLKFDTALPAGQYVVEFSQVAQAELLHYLVLPMMQKGYPNDTVAYYRNGEKDENLTLRLAVNLEGELLTLIPDGEEPATQPGTEPATQPGTEPATQPGTEPATQPGTEPATQPGTEPATQPETVPQTGDFSVTMFAVIAVLAMGAAVVFMKKKAF